MCFPNGGTIAATTLASYNWVLVRFYSTEGGAQDVRYNFFKPSEAVLGNRTLLLIQRSPARYASISRTDGVVEFTIVDDADTEYPSFGCTAKMWGLKKRSCNCK